jgi:hypothetical protein
MDKQDNNTDHVEAHKQICQPSVKVAEKPRCILFLFKENGTCRKLCHKFSYQVRKTIILIFD